MNVVLRSFPLLLGAAVVAMAAGCAMQPNSPVPLVENMRASAPAFVPLKAPRDCKGQKKKGSDVSVSERLSPHGGSLCIPAIDGVGGALEYPNVKPALKVAVTATTKDDGFPYPPYQPKAKAVLYLEIATTSSITFGTKLRSGAGVSGKGIKPHAMYTAYSAYNDFGTWRQPGGESVCFAVAKGGKRGGVLGLGSLLKGQTVGVGEFSGSPFLIEIFPGQLSQTAC
jgi:hypothetical protein